MTCPVLDPRSAARLVKLCGMLGSQHDGERAAAGLKADQLVRDLGLSWSDIIVPSDLAGGQERPPEPRTDWQRMAQYRHRCRAALNERERAFIATMLTWRGTPSALTQGGTSSWSDNSAAV